MLAFLINQFYTKRQGFDFDELNICLHFIFLYKR